MNGSGLLDGFRRVSRAGSVNGSGVVPVNSPDRARILRNAKHALDAACNASGDPADGSANRSTDRARRAVADSGALFSSAHDALRLRRRRSDEKSKAKSSTKNMYLHRKPPSNSLWRLNRDESP
jgi:hypothetical protein